MRKFLVFSFCLLALSALHAQDTLQLPKYHFRLDSTTIMIGDQTTLFIEPGSGCPTMEDLTGNDVLALRQWTDSASGSFCTTLTSFEEGEHWLHIGRDSVLITVKDVPNVDTAKTDIKDIANIFSQPYTFGEIAKVVGFILGICLLIAAAVFIIVRIRSHRPIITVPQAPPLPPDVRAMGELEELRRQQLWQQGMVKEYHTRLTDIVRNYLEETCSIQSTEMTTDQTLDAFQGSQMYTEESFDLLRQMLQTADMVKFAKSQPMPYQHDLSMSQAVDFIRKLKTMKIEK